MNTLQQQAMDRVGEIEEHVFGLGEPSGPAPDIFESMGLVKPDLGSLSIRTPQEPSSISGGGDRDEAMLSLLKEARNSLCALLPNPGEPDFMLALSRSNTADNEELCRALRAVRRAIASLTNPTEVSP